MALVRSQESKENRLNSSYDEDIASYLAYEDFSHTGLGLETYSDGVQHPLELRKILIGDLSQEMSVSFRLNVEENFKALVHPNSGRHGVEIYDSYGRVVTSFGSSLPKPPKLIKAVSSLNPFAGGLWDPDLDEGEELHTDEDDIPGLLIPKQRRPGRPPAQQGTFDPESGTIRYICRLNCGASLASAKGRRKHEKKHCPNVPKEDFGGYPMYLAGSNVLGHSLFGAGRSIPLKKQEWFECRICGKILKTYEGRRLHEKLQHLPKKSAENNNPSNQSSTSSDSKSMLAKQLQLQQQEAMKGEAIEDDEEEDEDEDEVEDDMEDQDEEDEEEY